MKKMYKDLLSEKGRTQMPNVLIAASECAPLAKTGGLADVVGTLPKALQKIGIDARVIIPYHRKIKEKYADQIEHMFYFYVCLGWRTQYAGIEKLVLDGVTIYLVDSEFYYGGDIYRGGEAEIEQYAFFQRAVLDCIPNLDFVPDVIHCNDWQTGLIPLLARTQYPGGMQENLKFLLTIHNIIPGLKFTSRYTYVLKHNYYKNFHHYRYEVTGRQESPSNASLGEGASTGYRWLTENTINYDNNFGLHNVSLMLSTTASKETSRWSSISGSGYSDESIALQYIDFADSKIASDGYDGMDTNVAVVARAAYSYADRYFLTASVRKDWAGRLVYEHNSGTSHGGDRYIPCNRHVYFRISLCSRRQIGCPVVRPRRRATQKNASFDRFGYKCTNTYCLFKPMACSWGSYLNKYGSKRRIEHIKQTY